ncbi:GNAT family N-acetyltransferase [Patescibacteria group bacterium]|nr:MAG: GNAT family N-acetyltransferase [Patescibacteria group bacterium]
MEVREATPKDRRAIVDLYKRSQVATHIPDPNFIPPEELSNYLYARNAIIRYVATEGNEIVGHGLIEHANPEHISEWRLATQAQENSFIELGGAFVDPARMGRGIWSLLLERRLHAVRQLGAIPVSVTWSASEHVKNHFVKVGGREIAQKETGAGSVSLFVF